jgi:superfamily II DNA or RNA helicase
MKIKISDKIQIYNAPEEQYGKIKELGTFENPVYIKNKDNGISNYKTNQYIKTYNYNHDLSCYELPRGLVNQVYDLFYNEIDDSKIEVLTKEIRLEAIKPVEEALELRDYQKDAIEHTILSLNGIIQMPCGAGKTITSIAAINELAEKTLILVHQKDLMDQWVGAISDYFKIDKKEIGIVGGGKNEVKDITVAMFQTVSRWSIKNIKNLSDKFSVLIVDECHHCPATTFYNVVTNMSCKTRIGLSATPYREDDLTDLMHAIMGPTIYQIEQTKLIEDGYLLKPEVKKVLTGFKYDGKDICNVCKGSGYRSGTLCKCCHGHRRVTVGHKLIDEMVDDIERTGLIAGIARKEVQNGKYVLLLSTRKDYCEDIRMASGVKESCTITSDTPKKERIEMVERARKGEIKLLCATQLADEGLDIPILDTCILALPIKAKGKTIQRIGRIMRTHENKSKQPTLYDIVDDNNTLRRQWNSRKSVYETMLGIDINHL